MHLISKTALITMTSLASLVAAIFVPTMVHAFCGFYVAGADTELYNNATMVVMMRDGTRTVLSMENNYQGPAKDFAMVVPVPVVLQKENVKTLPPEVFDHVDQLAAPRLVEYWEIDPCAPQNNYVEMAAGPPMVKGAMEDSSDADGFGVTIEAQFKVGEYDIVVLSASDSSGLERWLLANQYKIPKGAGPLLSPYVAAGMKFFVAKVDIKKVHMQNGMVKLSPLRFNYDTEQFALPVRLGMINSAGTQDLIVHILSPGKRFEVANYPNVTIPTNINVANETRQAFPSFYAALFDATVERNPGAVVTEYSWDAASCDPCPVPPLVDEDLLTLGADIIAADRSFVLTRLHARYGKGGLNEDLVFREAKPIAGGREIQHKNGKLERGAQMNSGVNNFQGRYIIRHGWTGPIQCENPVHGRWGGPPQGGSKPKLKVAQDTAFAPRDASLSKFVRQDIEELGYTEGANVSGNDAHGNKAHGVHRPPPIANKKSGCAGCSTPNIRDGLTGLAGGLFLAALVLVALRVRNRRRDPNSKS